MTTNYEFHDPQTLLSVANQLPKADDFPIYRMDPDAEGPSVEKLDEYKAVENPETGDVYGVVSDDYTVINPPTFIGPLVEEIKDRDRDDVRGSFTVHNNGGSGYGELLFDTDPIWPPDRSRSDEPVRIGMTLRYSHDNKMSVKAGGFAQDGMCENTTRQVTDSVYVKHTGDVGERVDWNDEWGGVLDQLGTFSKRLGGIIEEAIDHTLFDLAEHSFDQDWVELTDPQEAFEDIEPPRGLTEREMLALHGFYDYLGFPGYISLDATGRLMFRLRRKDDPLNVTAWDAHSAATYALSHDVQFDAGSSTDDQYHRIASDILTNPVKAYDDARRGMQRRMETDEEQDTLGIEETVGEAIEKYKEREELLRGAFN